MQREHIVLVGIFWVFACIAAGETLWAVMDGHAVLAGIGISLTGFFGMLGVDS